MPSPIADLIVLDTLGKLYAHAHGLSGYCRSLPALLPRLHMPLLIVACGEHCEHGTQVQSA